MALFSLAVWLGGVGQADEVKYGYISYPLKDNMQSKEGTIEVWVRPDMDLAAPPESFYYFAILRTSIGPEYPGKGGITLWRLKADGLTVSAEVQGQAGWFNMPSAFGANKTLDWKKGAWHHVALTWKGAELALYADGALLQSTTATAALPSGNEGVIMVGVPSSRIAVDEFVISSVARTGDQIRERMKSKPVKDDQTLLLDPMETLDKDGSRIEVAADNCRLVEGKFGKAVQLYQGK
jgi:hypothetical protein